MAGSAVITSINNPPPTGDAVQTFYSNATVANLIAAGTDVNWYDAAIGGNLLSPTTILVHGNTYYASQTIEGCESQNRLAVLVIIVLNKTINLHLFLEGLFDDVSKMMVEAKDGLTGEPKWAYGVADRIQVDLFGENYPYAPTGVSIGGIDLSTAGLATFQVSSVWSGNYYIRVRSRNHLETWSAIPVPFSSSTIDYYFNTSMLQAYGTNPQAQVSTNPPLYAFFLGDLEQGGWVDADDFNIFEPFLTTGITGFVNSDFNGSGWVDSDDFNLLEPRLTMGVASQHL